MKLHVDIGIRCSAVYRMSVYYFHNIILRVFAAGLNRVDDAAVHSHTAQTLNNTIKQILQFCLAGWISSQFRHQIHQEARANVTTSHILEMLHHFLELRLY